MKYYLKSASIEAMQFLDNSERLTELSDFMGEGLSIDYSDPDHPILKYQGTETNPMGLTANVFDYVVKLENGNFIGCPSKMFENLYSPIFG